MWKWSNIKFCLMFSFGIEVIVQNLRLLQRSLHWACKFDTLSEISDGSSHDWRNCNFFRACDWKMSWKIWSQLITLWANLQLFPRPAALRFFFIQIFFIFYSCVCKDGYMEVGGECIPQMECGERPDIPMKQCHPQVRHIAKPFNKPRLLHLLTTRSSHRLHVRKGVLAHHAKIFILKDLKISVDILGKFR